MLQPLKSLASACCRIIATIWVLAFLLPYFLNIALFPAIFAMFEITNFEISLVHFAVGLYWIISGYSSIKSAGRVRIHAAPKNKSTSRATAFVGIVIIAGLTYHFREYLFKNEMLMGISPSLGKATSIASPLGCAANSDWTVEQVSGYWLRPLAKQEVPAPYNDTIKTISGSDFMALWRSGQTSFENLIVNDLALRETIFRNKSYPDQVVLINVKFVKSSFSGSTLHINCLYCEFIESDFTSAKLSYAVFSTSKFTKPNFSKVTWSNITLTNSAISDAIATDGNGNITFNHSQLSNVDLRKFRGGITLQDSTVQKMDLRESTQVGFDAAYSQIDGLNLEGTNIGRLSLIQSEIKNSNFHLAKTQSDVHLLGVNFQNVDFTGLKMSYGMIDLSSQYKIEFRSRFGKVNTVGLKTDSQTSLPLEAAFWSDDGTVKSEALSEPAKANGVEFSAGDVIKFADGGIWCGHLDKPQTVKNIKISAGYRACFFKSGMPQYFVAGGLQKIRGQTVNEKDIVSLNEDGSLRSITGSMRSYDEGEGL